MTYPLSNVLKLCARHNCSKAEQLRLVYTDNQETIPKTPDNKESDCGKRVFLTWDFLLSVGHPIPITA